MAVLPGKVSGLLIFLGHNETERALWYVHEKELLVNTHGVPIFWELNTARRR
jgi:hypothetical protein